MHKYLEKKGEVNFDKIFNQRLGKLSLIPLIDLCDAVNDEK